MTTIQDRLRNPSYTSHAMGRDTFSEGENIVTMKQAADRIDALEKALRGMLDFVCDEEFCLCEYKDHTTPADEGPEVDAARAALGEGE